jgi:hypothetical protein
MATVYLLKAAGCFVASTFVTWTVANSVDAIPLWVTILGVLSAGLCFLGGVRCVRLMSYYGGRRTRIVINAASGKWRSHNASARRR